MPNADGAGEPHRAARARRRPSRRSVAAAFSACASRGIAAEQAHAEASGSAPARARQFVDEAFVGEGGQRLAPAAHIAAVRSAARPPPLDPHRRDAHKAARRRASSSLSPIAGAVTNRRAPAPRSSHPPAFGKRGHPRQQRRAQPVVVAAAFGRDGQLDRALRARAPARPRSGSHRPPARARRRRRPASGRA